ncbi:MAG: flavin reductase family protein [Thermoplasmatota archaeon]|nr:flavin reductase family protein [Halobacteriales archaeon]
MKWRGLQIATGAAMYQVRVAPRVEWDPAARPAKENYRFLTSAVAPRPIAWVTTVDEAGLVNAAPFSWFNSVCPEPPMVMLAIGARADGTPKDTVRNIRATREFVVNVVSRPLAEPMVLSAADYPPDVSEVEELDLVTAPSHAVRPPRLAASPVHLECVLHDVIPLGRDHSLVLGRIVHVGADDAVLDAKGNIDPAKVTFVGRMGGATYADTSSRFQVAWPEKAVDRLRTP